MASQYSSTATGLGRTGTSDDSITLHAPFTRFPKLDKLTKARLIGCPAPDGRSILPWRDANGEWTPWFIRIPHVVRMAGTQKWLTMVGLPKGMAETDHTPWDEMLSRAKKLPVTNPIKHMTKGDASHGAQIPTPAAMLAMQCFLLNYDGKAQNPPANHLLIVTKSGADALMDKLALPGINQASSTMSERFLGGDIVSPEAGRAILIGGDSALAPYRPQQAAAPISFDAKPASGFGSGGGGGGDWQAKKFGVEIGEVIPCPAEVQIKKFVPWDDLIHRWTLQEMMVQISTAYTGQELCVFFRDSMFEDMVPQALRDRYFVSGAVQVPQSLSAQTILTPTQPQVAPVVAVIQAAAPAAAPSADPYGFGASTSTPDNAPAAVVAPMGTPGMATPVAAPVVAPTTIPGVAASAMTPQMLQMQQQIAQMLATMNAPK